MNKKFKELQYPVGLIIISGNIIYSFECLVCENETEVRF